MKRFEKIALVAFLFILFLPLYGWIVQVLNGLPPSNLVGSFALKDGRKASFFNVFDVGDILNVEAESQWADTYLFEVYENSSPVLAKQGEFHESKMQAEILLRPPTFSAGHAYVTALHVYSYSKPILGVYYADSVNSAFTVESVNTSLGFQVEYDDLVGSLHLNARLTTVEGYPLANESVKFQVQFDKGRPTEGWVPVGSSETDASGEAELNLAFGLADGSYRVRAVYGGSENYGKSRNLTEIEVLSNSTLKNIGLETVIESEGSRVPTSITSVGDLGLGVSNSTPYALLPTTVRANYTVGVPLSGSFVFIVFFLDYTNSTGVLGSVTFEIGAGPPYVYEGSLIWSPSVLGQHRLVAQVGNGSVADLARMIYDGSGSIQSSEVSLDISRCPSNLVLEYPQALYSNVLPVTVAVAKPRPYEAESTEFYVTSTLAPRLFYGDTEYVVDEPVSFKWTRLFMNGTQAYANFTDEAGLLRYLIPISFSHAQLEAVVDYPLLYKQTVQRTVSLSKTRVYDKRTAEESVFELSYTIGSLGEAGKAYIGVNHLLEINSRLFNQPIWNVTSSVLIAKAVSNATTNGSGFVSVPAGADYLRVYNTAVLNGDANGDGSVGLGDSGFISAHWFPGPPVGPSGYHPDADLNRDGRVDISDSAIVNANWGKNSYYVTTNGWLRFYLDSQGFAKVPSGATGLTVYKDSRITGALVEFFKIVLEKSSRTNDLGRAEEIWTPGEFGRYVVQVKLPARFDTVVTGETGPVWLDAHVNLVGYYDVVKRRVDLTVEQWPAEPTLDTWRITSTARVFDAGLRVPMPGVMVWFYMKDVNGNWVLMDHIYSNSSGMAALTWSPNFYDVYLGLHGEFYLWVSIDQTEYTQWADNYPYVDARYKTRLEFLNGNGASMNVFVGVPYTLSVKLTRTDNGALVMYRDVDLYVNGASLGSARTDADGIAHWEGCVVNQAGVYDYKAVFQSAITYAPREARFTVVAEVAVTNVLFDVQPHDFTPSARLTLKATVSDAVSGQAFNGFWVSFYVVDRVGSKTLLGGSQTNSSGVATFLYDYTVGSGPHAFLAEAEGEVISSSGLMLTAARPTKLSVSTTRDPSSYVHYVGGILSGGGIMIGKQVRVYVNDTNVANATTYSQGDYSAQLNLPALNGQPTLYRILASFEGEGTDSATATALAPNGTQYAVSTTIHYSNKPASNSTFLIVEPQSTTATVQTKTPEQLQQEAEQSGWLTTWHEFTWVYPWYRIHFVSLYSGSMEFDLGMSALPLADTLEYAEFLLQRISQLLPRVIATIALTIAGAEFTALVASSYAGPLGFVAALGISLGTKLGALYANWNSVDGLISAYVGSLFATVLGLVRIMSYQLAADLIRLLLGIKSLAEFGFGKLYSIISVPINIIYQGYILQRLHELGALP